jgi:tetratricopeptide (TPR) repeat protein
MTYPAAALCGLGLLAAQYMVGRGAFQFLPLPAFFVVALAAVFGMAAAFQKHPALPRAGCVVSALALAAWVAVPLFAESWLWVEGGVLRVTLAAAIVYALVAFVIVPNGPRMVLTAILLAGAAIQAGLGIHQYMNPDVKLHLGWISELCPERMEGHAFRARGFYYNANHLAWLLNGAGAFALALGAWGRLGPWMRASMLYLAAMFFASGILTQSRGGLLGAAAALTVFMVCSCSILFHGAWGRRGRVLGTVGLSLLICAGAAWFAFSSSDLAQFRFLMLPEESYRPAVWQSALRQWQLEPLFGTGPGTFTNLVRTLRLRSEELDDIFAHNDWVQGLAELGLVGAGLGLCAIVLHLAAGWRAFGSEIHHRMATSRQPTSLRAAFQLGAMCSLAAFAVHSFFDFNMQVPANLLLLAACMGILASPNRDHAEKAAAVWGLRVCVVLIAGLGVLLAWMSQRVLTAERAWIDADNAFRSGAMEEALNHARRGVESNAQHARLHETAGRSALTLAKKMQAGGPERAELLEGAAESFSVSSSLDPGDAWQLVLLGHTRDNAKPSPADDALFFEAIERAPNFALPYEYFALHLEVTGRKEAAERLYALALAFPGTTFSRERLEALRQAP